MANLEQYADLATPLPGTTPGDRKVWSIPLESVWLPYFTATNTKGKTNLEPTTLGAPLRLAKDADGSVRFNKSGKPVLRVVKELSNHVKVVRENIAASLLAFALQTQKNMPKEYKAQVEAAQRAGRVILEADAQTLERAILLRTATAQAEPEREAVAA